MAAVVQISNKVRKATYMALPDKQSTDTKRIVSKAATRRARITYKKFYAIKFAIDLEAQSQRAICAFFNISEATYYRINHSDDYVAYKTQYASAGKKLNASDKTAPVDAPVTYRSDKKQVAEPKTKVNDVTRLLEKAEGILGQAYDLHRQAKQVQPAPARKPWFKKS